MRAISTIVAFEALPPVASSFAKREINDPAGLYLDSICYPNYSNRTRASDLNITWSEITSSLALSPFPCEQHLYIGVVCSANGTTEIDFIAEQECFCKGAFFDVAAACDNCLLAHGYQGSTPQSMSAALASLSAAGYQPSPPFQPFSNVIPPVNFTSALLNPPLTLGDD